MLFIWIMIGGIALDGHDGKADKKVYLVISVRDMVVWGWRWLHVIVC